MAHAEEYLPMRERVLVISNHWGLQRIRPLSGIFVDRQIASLRRAGIEIETFDLGLSYNPSLLLRKVFELRSVVKRFKPNIVHGRYGTIVGFLSTFAGPPAVVTFCGGDLLAGAPVSLVRLYLGFLLSNLGALRAAAVICVSDELRQALWCGKARAVVIPDAVDLDLFTPGEQEASRKELGWNSSGPMVILNAAGDPKRKGVDVAEAAMAIVTSHIPAAQLHIIRNVEPSLMPLYYRAADVLLCASTMEGSPNVVKEALACNLPVVSTRVGDVEERLKGVHPSALVPRNPVAIAEALVQILLTRSRCNGQEHVSSVGLDEVASRVIEVYRSILKSSSLNQTVLSESEGC
jgi:teichuronic acid biosynthesis glycosyltransferase TuaC